MRLENGFIGRSWSVPLNSNLYEINVRVGPPPQRAWAIPDLIARDLAHEIGPPHHMAWANSDLTVRNPFLERAAYSF